MSLFVNKVINSPLLQGCNVKGYLFDMYFMWFTCVLLLSFIISPSNCFEYFGEACDDPDERVPTFNGYFEFCEGYDKSNTIVHLENLEEPFNENCMHRQNLLNGTITIDKDITSPVSLTLLIEADMPSTYQNFFEYTDDDICENLDEGYIWHTILEATGIDKCAIKAGDYPFSKPAQIQQHDVDTYDIEQDFRVFINMTGVVDNQLQTLGCYRIYIRVW